LCEKFGNLRSTCTNVFIARFTAEPLIMFRENLIGNHWPRSPSSP